MEAKYIINISASMTVHIAVVESDGEVHVAVAHINAVVHLLK